MLRARSTKGAFWLTVGGGGQQAVSLLVFIYLTRNLNPTDFGIIALASVFIDLLAMACCFGQMELVQQRPSPIKAVATAAFWLIQGLAVLATIVLVVSAPWIARLMGTPALETYLLLLSPAILLTTLGQVHEALLRRRMRYRPLAFRNVVATVCSGLAALIAIEFDFPAVALVAQRLTFIATMTGILWITSSWRPRFEFSLPTMRSLVPSGFHIMAANVSSQQNARIIDFIVGVTLGTYWLGQMKIAWRIFDFLAQISLIPISNVALSLFSRSGTPERLEKNFNETVKMMALVSCPLFFGLSALATDLTNVVLGPKWSDAADLIEVLGFMSVAAIVNYIYFPLLIVVGRTGHVLAQSLLQNAMTAAFAAVGAAFGAHAVMVAHAVRSYLLAASNLYVVQRATGFSLLRVFRTMAPPVLASGIMAAALVMMRPFIMSHAGAHLSLVISIAAGGLVYLIVLALGDVLGLWPGYARRAGMSLKEAIWPSPSIAKS